MAKRVYAVKEIKKLMQRAASADAATAMGGTMPLGTPAHRHDGPEHTALLPIERISTAETDSALVAAPDGTGGVEFRADTGGGGGAFDGARVGVFAFTQITRLSDVGLTYGGYAFPDTSFDTGSYVTTYGALGTGGSGIMNPAATVFAIPSDGIYRISGCLAPDVTLANGGASFLCLLTNSMYVGGGSNDANSGMPLQIPVALNNNSGAGAPAGATIFCWEGRLVKGSPSSGDLCVGIDISYDGALSTIGQSSYFMIQKIG